jgi:hypothetical protein
MAAATTAEERDGFRVGGVGSDGFRVGSVGSDGFRVGSVGSDGFRVGVGSDGFLVGGGSAVGSFMTAAALAADSVRASADPVS